MIYVQPLMRLCKRTLGLPVRDIEGTAADQWEVSPAVSHYVRPARYLPGQLARIRGTEFSPIEVVVRAFEGDFEAAEAATIAYRLRDVGLVDGALYASGAYKALKHGERRLPVVGSLPRVASGALYESWLGNRWFGNWLSDDCLTYRLVETLGVPTTSALTADGHKADYERRLGMRPERIAQAQFDELILIEDGPNNDGKRERARDCRERLVAGCQEPPHPGVFLLRGQTGARRVLVNEREIAAALARKRGFRVLDPSQAALDDIIRDCATARVVAGVEGSQLVHGLAVMADDAALLVIQPPERVVSALKIVTDRRDLTYAFVVAEGGEDEFRVSLDEIERTLDLL